jgi:hypothetical protein
LACSRPTRGQHAVRQFLRQRRRAGSDRPRRGGHTGGGIDPAANPGNWGNYVRLSVDHDTTYPAHLFNLTVTRVDKNTPPMTLATEIYRNL